MTALAEALTAAQRQAIASAERAYIAGIIDHEGLITLLDEMGCTDKIEQGYLWAALETLKQLGASAPTARDAKPADAWKTEPMSEAQRRKIVGDCDARSVPYPDFEGLTKGQASEIIESIKVGTYDPDKWAIPF